MNPTHDEENLIRWLDGEMDEAEMARFEARLEADAALKAEALEMKRMTEAVRQHLPQPTDIPHADFFNSQVQREIDVLKAEKANGTEVREPVVMRWWKLPWLIAASAALVAVMAIMKPRLGVAEGSTEVVSSYAPNPEVQVSIVESSEAQATVVMLEGLPEIPAGPPMVGYKVSRSENDPQMAMTTLFSDSGEVLLVMGKDGRDLPKFTVR